jgi:hypothetical protein
MGALTGTRQILETIMEKGSKIQVIQQEDKTFLLEYKENLTFLLICRRSQKSHRFLLKQFANEFLEAFGEVLEQPYHDTNFFRPADRLVEEIFYKQ